MPTPSVRQSSSQTPVARRRFRGLAAEERQNQRRQKLLEAGLEAFGTRGFHAVGIREICTQAKLTERYFYESFKNREELFAAVYQLAVERIRSAIIEALAKVPSQDGADLARAGLRATLEAYRADPRLARISLIDLFSAGVGNAPFTAGQTYAGMIEQLTHTLYPDLDARRVDVRLLASGLFGSTLSIVMHWVSTGFRLPLEHVLEHSVLFYESVINEVRRRLSPTAKPKSKSHQPKTKPKRTARTRTAS